jgi:atypical dual specificity phosphatase
MSLPPNFSFIWKNLVAGSGHPAGLGNLSAVLGTLRQRGFGAILSLTESPLEFSSIREFGFEYLHLPIDDFTAPTEEQVETGVAFIEQQIAHGHAALVHCHAGIGRTGTLLACFLVGRGADAATAIQQVRRLRPGSLEVYSQEYAVYQFAKKVHDAADPGSQD